MRDTSTLFRALVSPMGYRSAGCCVKLPVPVRGLGSNFQENHQGGDHIDHVVRAHGMFPVPPGKRDGQGQAIQHSRHPKSLLERARVTQAKDGGAEERRADQGDGRPFAEGRSQQEVA